MRHIYKITIIAILVIGGSAMGKSTRSDAVQPMERFRLMKVKGVPHEINYQGWLGTADDTTGITGTFTMVFKIYDAETGGNNLWSETHEVQVSHGVFNVILGSSNPIPAEIFTGAPLWLEISIAGEVLSPRQKLVSVGYAIHAESAQSADVAGHAMHADTAGYVEYVDSAGIAVNAWRWNNNMWGVEYPKANVADTANYADTAGYALSTDVNYVDSADVATNAWRWNNNMWGVEYPKANVADTANYADTAGYALSTDVNYVDSADVAANAWRWNNNIWGVEYPKANVADTATYADTAGYALSADVNYVDSAGVAVNAWKWDNNMWGVEYPKANVADTANYADTAGYALSADVNYVDSAGVAANAWRWNNNTWGVEYPKANVADTANYVAGTNVAGEVPQANYADTAGYAPDNDWVRETSPANYLRTYGYYGIARKGAVLYGNYANTHVNLGVACTTGTAGSNRYYCTVGGGLYNTASGSRATVAGGESNIASNSHATVAGGLNNTASSVRATVGGGYYNTASSYYATVSGGYGNTASGSHATVGGGYGNTASGLSATVAGGYGNTADTTYATVGGGYYNTASGYAATVGGGESNTASGYAATVIGGYADTAAGSYSIAGGYHSVVPSSYSNSVAFNGQTATASGQLRCGNISKTGGGFTIDHPLDPDNKILNHYFVESPEMVLIYRGVAVIGANRRTTVHLPEYFDALNRNPMIQLTGVGTSDVYVVEEVHNNQFVIGGKPGTKVYWIVTGERKDQSAEIIRALMPVEQQKTGALVGRSLDDEFLATTMKQLEEIGISYKFHFRTAAGSRRYELMKQPPQKPVEEINEPHR